LPGLPGFALLLSDWLDQAKNRVALALCVALGFMSLVIAYHVPGADFYKSQKPLVDSYLQHAGIDERLIYLDERPDSAQFYLHGKALKSSISATFQDGTNHDFYVLKKKILDSLSGTIKAQLEPVASYGRFSLLHAVAVNKK
jgi:hypothetical protein